MDTVLVVEQVVHTVQVPDAAAVAVVLQEVVHTVQVPDAAAVAVVLQEVVQVVQAPAATAVAVVLQESVQVVTVGLQGPAGPSGSLAAPPIAFGFGDASPRTVATVASAVLVLSVRINVSLAFNGVAPSFRLGTAALPELLVAAAQLDLGTATEFEINPNGALAAGAAIVLTLAPGAGSTQGAGWIVIEQIAAT